MKNYQRNICPLLLMVFVLALMITACSPGDSTSPQQSNTTIRVASLLGPTGMGMVKLMADHEQGRSELDYEFSLGASPDDLVSKVINKEIDVAALPTNLALLLYNKTGGQIQLAAVNTLGVLYLVENGEEVNSVSDLKGKEVYISGKGTTPDFVMQYLLEQHGLVVEKDVNLDYFTQHSDLAAALVGGDVEIGLLPQPHVTTALMKNQNLRSALDITQEWKQVTADQGQLAMGCIVVQKDFADNNRDALNNFLAEYQESVSFVNENVDQAAELMEQYGILPNQDIAKKAIPYSNIVYIDAQEVRTYLDEYYKVLYDFEPSSIGGKLADEGFYYSKK